MAHNHNRETREETDKKWQNNAKSNSAKTNDLTTLWTEKNTSKCFLLYILENLTDSDKIGYVFAVQKCRRFPVHLNDVSALPCET